MDHRANLLMTNFDTKDITLEVVANTSIEDYRFLS